MRTSLLVLLFSLLLYACKYVPFVTYYRQSKDTNLPKFSKKTQFAGEVNAHRGYDITSYDWLVAVDPDKKRISGAMEIDFVFEETTDVILLDLQRKLNIDKITSLSYEVDWKHKGDLLYVYFDKQRDKGTSSSIKIDYHGKPAIVAKQGPIQWKTDANGNPWISTQTEGVGAHYMMPCKELLYDEPARSNIRVTVPEELVVVANGSLDSVTTMGSTKTYHHSLRNPINIYNISFNIGDYTSYRESYRDVQGVDRPIEVFALSYELDSAKEIYRQTPLHLDVLEELYGPFPWWDDGCKIVQTTLDGGAMEHQSAISMGAYLYNDFQPSQDSLHVNTTLIHELAHEWWGNLISGYDYCDMWIHEGMATYSEALVIEQLYRPLYYDKYIQWLARGVDNERPILKTCGVRYNSWVSYKDADIYNKGALLMHTLRKQLADDQQFFVLLKSAVSRFDRQNITTDQLVQFFDEQTEIDVKPLFDMYLKYATPPTMEYRYDNVKRAVTYRWKEPLKGVFPLRVDMTVSDDKIPLYPSEVFQTVEASVPPQFDIADFGYVLIEEIAVD